MSGLVIRPAQAADDDAIWQILQPVIRAGETYAFPRDWPRGEALGFWARAPRQAFVAVVDGAVVGTYYLRANQLGPGAHVANCGYVTAPAVQGRGIARSMALHSIDEARRQGFRAMQYNLVVSRNEHAVRLWQSLGFKIVGTLPGAFAHPRYGDVDAHVMIRQL